MTIRFNPRWLLVISLVFSLQVCQAQSTPPVVIPPLVSFDLGDTNNPDSQLWDLSGQYTLDMLVLQKNGLALPVSLSFTLIQAPNGKISGPTNDNTEALIVNENGFFAVAPRVTGKVTGSDGMARVQLSIRFAGTGQIANGPTTSVNGSFSVVAETDSSGNLIGTRVGKFSVNISGEGSTSGKVEDFSTPMPFGANSTWNLSLQMVGLKKIAGSAVITTPGRALGFDLSGKYNGIFNVAAKGVNNVQDTVSGVGASARMQLTPAFDSIAFKGKVLGQSLVFSAFND